jgi:hypothetical protein
MSTTSTHKPYRRRRMHPPIREGFDRLSYFPPCSLDTLLDRVDHNRKRSWFLAVDRHNSAMLSGNHDDICYLDCPFIGDEYPHYIIENTGAHRLSMWRVSTFRSDLRP